MNDEMHKLSRLLPHWAEHSAEHAETFRKWAELARTQGRETTAQRLERAAMLTDEAANALRAAIDRASDQ